MAMHAKYIQVHRSPWGKWQAFDANSAVKSVSCPDASVGTDLGKQCLEYQFWLHPCI